MLKPSREDVDDAALLDRLHEHLLLKGYMGKVNGTDKGKGQR